MPLTNKKILAACFFLLSCGKESESKTDVKDTLSTNGKYRAAIVFSAGPEASTEDEDKENKLAIQFEDVDGKEATSLADVTFEPYMSIHGHGAPTVDLKTTCDTHQCTVTGLYFTMSGPWELNFNATVNGSTDKITFKVNVP